MTTKTYSSIQVEQREAVATITLNKPPLNILDVAMIDEIQEAMQAIEADPGVRVIVFRAAGEKAFCAGVSIDDHTPDKIQGMIPRFHATIRLLARTDKVTVAAVQGHCLGGGLELACICDLIIAAEKAAFGQPEIKLGQLPPVGIVLLPMQLSQRQAAGLLLTGSSIRAPQAESMGLVNRSVPADQLDKALEELLAELNSLSGSALAMNKQLLRRLAPQDFEKALDLSEEFFLKKVAATDDAKEGIFSFLEKRPPKWTHRQ